MQVIMYASAIMTCRSSLQQQYNNVLFEMDLSIIVLYYTLRFYFPYLSLLAQPVTIFVYGPVTILVYGPARYLHYYFR